VATLPTINPSIKENNLDTHSFSDFPKEGIQFLSDLAKNNNREWFQSQKNVFQEKLQKPAQLFVVALGVRLQELSNGLCYDTRINGSG
jgi:uncharacterized protein (DUF2461 family)